MAIKRVYLIYVCSEINLVLVPPHTWWIDNYISDSMRNFQTQRRPSPAERYIYMGDGNKVVVEAVGVCRFRLDSGFILDLDEIHMCRLLGGILFSFHC